MIDKSGILLLVFVKIQNIMLATGAKKQELIYSRSSILLIMILYT